jgi:hypothetical protein
MMTCRTFCTIMSLESLLTIENDVRDMEHLLFAADLKPLFQNEKLYTRDDKHKVMLTH